MLYSTDSRHKKQRAFEQILSINRTDIQLWFKLSVHGGFNCPDIQWCKEELLPIQCTSSVSSVFIDFISRYAFLQFVTNPTRGRNILDLVLCNDSFAVSGLQVEPSFSNSDHNAISFDLFYTDLIGTSKRPDIKKFNFKKANWENIMLQVSSLDWNELFSNLQYDQLWDVFISEMFSIIERCVPLMASPRGTSISKKYSQIANSKTCSVEDLAKNKR